jgi:hypothetical protein
MIRLSTRLIEGAVVANVFCSGKSDLLLRLSAIAAENYFLDAAAVHDGLTERERLGPTGFGGGTAIPHCKVGGTICLSAYSPGSQSRSVTMLSMTSQSIWSAPWFRQLRMGRRICVLWPKFPDCSGTKSFVPNCAELRTQLPYMHF